MDRSEFIGASEVAALFDAHPFKTPLDIFNDKMGLTPEKKSSKALSLGNFLEDGLIQYFCEEYLNCNVLEGSNQRHIRIKHSGATLDFIAENGNYKRRKFDYAPCDIKTIGLTGKLPYHDEYGKGGSAEVPTHVYYQLQQQMHLFSLDGDIEVKDGFIGLLDMQGRGTLLYRVPYAPHIGEMLFEATEKFWADHIVTKTPPEEGKPFIEINF